MDVRTDVPDILPHNNPGLFVPNDTITVVDTVRAQEYKGNDVVQSRRKWIWSGAVQKRILTEALDWWRTAYHFVDAWKELGTSDKEQISL